MKDILDSRQLRTFVTVARTGSFTRTAKEVFLTQSAVSQSMGALEKAHRFCGVVKVSLELYG